MALDEALIERALQIAGRNPESFVYFFERLASPDWIEALDERGLFGDPPDLETTDGYVRAPVWPPSQFLARVAAQAPNQVLAIALEIETDNERIHEDLTNAALAMPAARAVEWATQEIRWLQQREHLYFLLPDKLAQLAVHLGQQGEIEVALALFVQLFRPVGVEREAAGPWDFRTARTRVEHWQYNMLLERTVSPLVDAAPAATAQALVGLVGQCLDLAQVNVEDPLDDYSYIWRPRLSDEHRDEREPEQALVSALRDVAVATRDRALLPDAELVNLLLVDARPIFRRIAMHSLSTGPEPDLGVAADLVVDRATLRSDRPSVEYQELLERVAPELETDSFNRLVAWIDAGPDIGDVEDYVRRVREYGNREPAPDEAAEYTNAWRARRLRLLIRGLSDEGRRQYDQLVERVGEQRFTVPFEVTTWVGPTSPLSLIELRELDDDGIVDYLSTWEESGDLGPEPSIEGLARTLKTLAEEESARMSRLSARLRGLHPQYAYWTLMGLSAAVRNNQAVDWEPIFQLVHWVLEQESDRAHDDLDRDSEPRVVGWAHGEVASVIEAGLRSAENPIPIERRQEIWQVLGLLAMDPDPRPAREEREGGTNFDPATLALNSVRGRALHAAVFYGLWVRRQINADGETEPQGLDAMPELRDLLNAHLDPQREPSAAVRSVYGQFLPQLAYLDTGWVRDSSPQIFPREPELVHLRNAAWGAYVVFSRPYEDLFEILESDYYLAVARLGDAVAERWIGSSESPEERLGDHLMSLYWRGRLSLEEGQLVHRFFQAAPAELRAHALTFVGSSARDQDQLDTEVVQRLESLWEARARKGLNDLDANAIAELKAFAWWLSATSLSMEWRLTQTEKLVEAGVYPAPEFLVFQALQQAVSGAPALVTRVLRKYLEGVSNSWAISAHTDEVTDILRIALDAPDASAQSQARDTIHYLGALGLRQYRELLARGSDVEEKQRDDTF